MIVHAVRHVKLLVFRPAVIPFRETDLVFAQGFAVGPAGILFVGRAVSDVTVNDDQRGAIVGAQKSIECTA